jgi:UDP-N-acetylmuramate dehydrogenase
MLNILDNVSLKNYNTFGVEVKTRYFAEINQEDDLISLFKDKKWQQCDRLILGGGSNILFTGNFDGLIVHMNIKGIRHEITQENVLVEAGGGEVWNDLVNYCVSHDFGGIENLSLIPGSVGASPVQNIGAYGVELKDVFHSCRAFEVSSGTFKTFNKEECEFAYRESVFKGRLKNQYIITSVKFSLSLQADVNTSYGAILDELQKRNIREPNINAVSEVVSHIRVSKLPDPSTIGNAGSFFKNPIVQPAKVDQLRESFQDLVSYPLADGNFKLAAGWLIEQCGWKGKVIGNAGTWKNQALVLVNHGGASGAELYNLSSQIIDSVYEKFGILLEREVNIIP